MTDHLYPTPSRLALLDEAIADQLFGPSARITELERAGWIEPYDPPSSRWRATAYGRAIRDVRILDFGPHLIVAETGDPDEPRYLGGAVPAPGKAWLIQLARQESGPVAVQGKHAARAELRHMAASLLAAETGLTDADLSEVEATH